MTPALKWIIQQLKVGAQLDQMLAAQWPPATGTRRIRNPNDLPLRFEQRVKQRSPNTVWRAYSDESQVWLVIARAADLAFADPPASTLEVCFFAEDARVCAAASWIHCGRDGWRLYEVLDIAQLHWLAGTESALETA